LNTILEKCRERYQTDLICIKDSVDLGLLQQRLDNLDLTKQQRRIINDYIACLLSLNERKQELAFQLGIEECINKLELLMTSCDKM